MAEFEYKTNATRISQLCYYDPTLDRWIPVTETTPLPIISSELEQTTVRDGEEVISRDDPEGRDPSTGFLDYGKGPDGKAKAIRADFFGSKYVIDDYVIGLLSSILIELRKINVYNAVAHDNVVSDKDVLTGDEI